MSVHKTPVDTTLSLKSFRCYKRCKRWKSRKSELKIMNAMRLHDMISVITTSK